ncbi:MAG: hypothetical protein N2690_03605 [Rhodocyclaceae bacterium]|nr:hypothetical protein [Rhodocyclaceae bacterium]
MKKSQQLHERVVPRLLKRLRTQGMQAAVEYGAALLLQFANNKKLKRALREEVPQECYERIMARHSLDLARQQIKVVLAAQEQERRPSWQEEQKRRVLVLQESLVKARAIGQTAVFLASLSSQDRAQTKASAREVRAAIEMRKRALKSGAVMAALGCSRAELNRWAQDGRLPVLFQRKIPISGAATSTLARYWDYDVVQQALDKIDLWREEDQVARSRRMREAAQKRASRTQF